MDDPYPPSRPVPDGDRERRPWPTEDLPPAPLYERWRVIACIVVIALGALVGWLR